MFRILALLDMPRIYDQLDKLEIHAVFIIMITRHISWINVILIKLKF